MLKSKMNGNHVILNVTETRNYHDGYEASEKHCYISWSPYATRQNIVLTFWSIL